MFVKGSHERQFAYEAHTACDKNGFVLETVVTPGNVHDSVAFDEVYDKVTKTFPETESIVADSAYKTPHICKKVFDDGRVLSTAYKRPQTMKGGHEWWRYVYDEFYDCVICPNTRSSNMRQQTGTAAVNTRASWVFFTTNPSLLGALHTLLVFVGDRSGAKPNRVSEVDLIVQNTITDEMLWRKPPRGIFFHLLSLKVVLFPYAAQWAFLLCCLPLHTHLPRLPFFCILSDQAGCFLLSAEQHTE